MPAEAAVDQEKRLSTLAREYLRHCAHSPSKPPDFRFDVISVYLESNVSQEITLFRDASRLS
jgi:hypothetical protein